MPVVIDRRCPFEPRAPCRDTVSVIKADQTPAVRCVERKRVACTRNLPETAEPRFYKIGIDSMIP